MSENKIRSPSTIIAIVRVANGYAVYDGVPGYNLSTDRTHLPFCVFETKIALANWINAEWSPE